MEIDIPDREDEQPLTLCETQERLNADPNGEYKDEMMKFFEKWYNNFNTKLNSGVSPEDYEKYKALVDCTCIAGGIINAYWTMLHEAD